jgi:hypothetical protein
MKPLNRPMFRYGGPIKEGIMTGMKDRAALVGNPVFPKGSDGRAQHAIQIPLMIGAGLQALRTGAMRVAPKVASYFRSRPFIEGGGKGIAGKYQPAPLTTTEKIKQFFQTAPAGKYLSGSPEGRIIGSTITGSGKIGKFVKGAATTAAKSPLTIGAGVYYGGGALLPDGTPDPNDPKNIKSGEVRQFTGDEAAVGDPRKPLPDTKKPSNVKLEDLTKDRIEKTKERYYKIFGLDNMKKEAVYDSLIDASKVIQQEGADLKGSLKSGSLQAQIIDAISKNLDKSAALKKQIDAAILKGEIEKDVAGAKPGSYLKQAQDYAAMKGVSVDQAYKDLGFDKRGDLFEGVQNYFTKNKVAPAGNDLATLARSYKIDITGIEDTTTVKNRMKEKGYDEVGYLTEILSNPEAQVAPGNYVINSRVLNVDADKKITPVF